MRNHRWQDVSRWEPQGNSLFDSPELKEQRFAEDFYCGLEGQCEDDRDDKGALKMIETNEIPFKRLKTNAALTSLTGFDVRINFNIKMYNLYKVKKKTRNTNYFIFQKYLFYLFLVQKIRKRYRIMK